MRVCTCPGTGVGWCEVERVVGVWGERARMIFYQTKHQILCTHYTLLCPSAGMCQACCVPLPVPHLCSVCTSCTRVQALESIYSQVCTKVSFPAPPSPIHSSTGSAYCKPGLGLGCRRWGISLSPQATQRLVCKGRQSIMLKYPAKLHTDTLLRRCNNTIFSKEERGRVQRA